MQYRRLAILGVAAGVAMGASLALSGRMAMKSTASAGQMDRSFVADATTTGVPAGLALKPSTGFVVTTPHATISGLDITGMVTIAAPNVTLRNCRISASGWAALDVHADGATIENCEIDGRSAPGIRGISVLADNVSIRHCNIHHSEDGIYLAKATDVTIDGNYIHDLQSNWDGPHFDGIATDGQVSNVYIHNNNVINPHNQTSAVMISNYFGPASQIYIEENRLIGGGYTIYVDGQFSGGRISDVSVTRNRLKRGFYGYASVQRNDPVWQGNVDERLGTPVGR